MFWFSAAVVNSVELLPQQISEKYEKSVPKTKNINSVELPPQKILENHENQRKSLKINQKRFTTTYILVIGDQFEEHFLSLLEVTAPLRSLILGVEREVPTIFKRPVVGSIKRVLSHFSSNFGSNLTLGDPVRLV